MRKESAHYDFHRSQKYFFSATRQAIRQRTMKNCASATCWFWAMHKVELLEVFCESVKTCLKVLPNITPTLLEFGYSSDCYGFILQRRSLQPSYVGIDFFQGFFSLVDYNFNILTCESHRSQQDLPYQYRLLEAIRHGCQYHRLHKQHFCYEVIFQDFTWKGWFASPLYNFPNRLHQQQFF